MYYDNNLALVQDYPSPDGIWELVEKIGEGNYGVVYKGRNKKTGQIGAVKIMDATLDKEEDIKSELNVFQNFSHHDNVVECYGVYLKKQEGTNDQLWIIMEYCAGGCVTDLVKKLKEKGETLPEDLIAYILREITNGIAYLHRQKVMHRDIKGQNVMLTHDGRVRLIDFGIAASVDGAYARRNTAIGTPYWMSPEVIACECQLDSDYDVRTDIWSLGITAIEIVDSVPPLFGENPLRALYKIPQNPPPKFENPNRWSRQLNDFVAKCLVKDFEKRPDTTQLLQHEYLQFVPKDPRVLRRKLMALLDIPADAYTQQNPMGGASETSLGTHSQSRSGYSSHTSTGLDTAQRNLLAVRTVDLKDDLASLEFIDETILVGQLMKRYKKGFIYTNVGDILVSVNPFQQLDIYKEEIAQRYHNITKHSKGSLPPHIYAIAGAAYQGLLREMRNQCCIVSGESGAGKTEASNILVRQFMKLGRSESKALEMKILALNPLLESFGNAKTVINSNSSRFGKYLELYFTKDGRVAGAKVFEYLLERSRVIFQSGKERNFHIFYYMMAALAERKQLKKYKLKSTHHHRYLRQVGTSKASEKRNPVLIEKFEEVEKAFTLFGFSSSEFDSVCQILAAVLSIGDIKIEENISNFHLGEVSMISNPRHVITVGEVLGVDDELLKQMITMTSVITHGDKVSRHNTVEQAMDTRDATAKALYGRLFSWIVNKLNPTMSQSLSRYSKLTSIGILDIFGFENHRINSFEQLCINITNEQLQFYFNQHVFAWELEEYQREGIEGVEVDYQDNRHLLDMLLKRPMGLLALLDEESKFPRANDLTLAMKFHHNFSSSHYYTEPKDSGGSFIVHHYAGQVIYDTQGFLEKNRDTLKQEVICLLRDSTNAVVSDLFSKSISRTGRFQENTPKATPTSKLLPPFTNSAAPIHTKLKSHNFLGVRPDGNISSTPLSASISGTMMKSQTVSTYFYYSLRDLINKMLLGTPHFVRCIRPNDLKTPREFHPEKVQEQLRYTGVLETIRIRREGYSHRMSFEDFIQRYKLIAYPLSLYVIPSRFNCEKILKKIRLEKYLIGRTKIFLKYHHVEKLWEVIRDYNNTAIAIQKAVRGWLCRKEVERLRESRRQKAAIVIQTAVRKFIATRNYKRMLEARLMAVKKLQTALRRHLSKVAHERQLNRERATICIQKHVKRVIAMRMYKAIYKEHKAITLIQKHVRWYLIRRAIQKIHSAIIVQRSMNNNDSPSYRRWKARIRVRLQVHQREAAALKIQKAVKSWLFVKRLRKERKQLIEKRERAAQLIQKAYRQYLFRLDAKKTLREKLKAKEAHQKFIAAKLIASKKTAADSQSAESLRSKLEKQVVATMQEMEKRLGAAVVTMATEKDNKLEVKTVSLKAQELSNTELITPMCQCAALETEVKPHVQPIAAASSRSNATEPVVPMSFKTKKVQNFFEDLIQSKRNEPLKQGSIRNNQPTEAALKNKRKGFKSEVFMKLFEKFESN